MADAPSVISELVRLAAHLAGFFYSECGGGPEIAFVRKQMILILASNTVRPDAAHTTMITPITFLACLGGCETTPASSG